MERIFASALDVFAEYGYHGATMKRVAAAAGLSYGLVYHYFSSKERVFRYVVDTAMEGPAKALAAILGEAGGAWEKITRLSRFLVREAVTGESSRYFLVVLQALTVPEFAPEVAAKIEGFYGALAPCIVEAQAAGDAAAGDPYVLAASYFSLVQGLALLAVQRSGLERRITPDILTNVLRSSGGGTHG